MGSTAVVVGATLAAQRAYSALSQSDRGRLPLALAVIACLGEALLVLALLRAEESRLTRELRIARQGTPLLRAMIRRRRQRGPMFARLLATQLGGAAVCLADGDESAARDLLAMEPPWLHIGRLGALRKVVLADADRGSGTPAARSRCIQLLRGGPPIGNREADLYRVFVLVKAVLEHGDDEVALDLASSLERAPDADERTYSTWLRVWFDLDAESVDAWRAITEEDARLAILGARSQGAEALVGKLEARLLAIARPARQG